MERLPNYFCVIVEECIESNMSKDETVRHLWDNYQIPYEHANIAWNHLESTDPDLFIAYNARIRERNAQPLGNPPNVQRYAAAASPQEANAVYPSTQAGGPSRAANANAVENQNLQNSQQEAAYPNDLWQKILTTLGQIQSNTQHLGHIQSNTDQIVNIMTDGHGSGPHPSAAGSSKRQRVGEAEERCNSEEAAKLQEKEEGDGEESEKLQEKDRDHN